MVYDQRHRITSKNQDLRAAHFPRYTSTRIIFKHSYLFKAQPDSHAVLVLNHPAARFEHDGLRFACGFSR